MLALVEQRDEVLLGGDLLLAQLAKRLHTEPQAYLELASEEIEGLPRVQTRPGASEVEEGHWGGLDDGVVLADQGLQGVQEGVGEERGRSQELEEPLELRGEDAWGAYDAQQPDHSFGDGEQVALLGVHGEQVEQKVDNALSSVVLLMTTKAHDVVGASPEDQVERVQDPLPEDHREGREGLQVLQDAVDPRPASHADGEVVLDHDCAYLLGPVFLLPHDRDGRSDHALEHAHDAQRYSAVAHRSKCRGRAEAASETSVDRPVQLVTKLPWGCRCWR